MNEQEQREYREHLQTCIRQTEQVIQNHYDDIDRKREEIKRAESRLTDYQTRLAAELMSALEEDGQS
jgi:hypothetical protein